MFLDDEVLEMCKKTELNTPKQMQDLYTEVATKFEDYYKVRISMRMLGGEIKAVLTKTFNLWDSFVRMRLKSNDHKLLILGELFQRNSLKSQFLKNEEMAKFYNSL